MLTPLITITLSYISGLILGCGFLYFPVTITALMLSGLAISILLTRKKKLSLRHVLIISASCSLGAVFYVASAAYFPENHYNRTIVFDKEKHEVFGRIVTPLDRDPGRTSFIIKAQKIDNTPISGKMRVSARDEKISAGYGDLVRLSGRIFQPTGFANPKGFYYPEHLARQGVYANVSVRDAGGVELIRPGKGIFRTIQDWRENIRQSIRDKTTGPGSAIMQAMVLGEEGGLTDEVRDRFMAAGVTHILSISGSHLGLVALLCFGLIRGMLFLLPEKQYNRLTIHADPKKIAAWLTIPPVVFYALLAGGQIATLRSLVMILAAMTALVLDRENSLMRSLAAAALLILTASPQALFDISFQLSYISVISIGYVVTLSNELSIQAKGLFGKIRNSAALLAAISLAASLVTGPLVAFYFNQFSFVGIISNMLIVPFAGAVIVPLGLLSGILSLFIDSLPFAGVLQISSDAFYSLVSLFARVPFAEFHPRSPGIIWILTYGIFIFLLAGFAKARLLYAFKPFEYPARASRMLVMGMAISGAVFVLGIIIPLLPKQETQVTFIDVGQGDSALIELSSGRNILIDGGGAYDGRFDIGRRVTAPYLWNSGIKDLDLVILSHPHPDHMNGLKFILNKFSVREVWDSGQAGEVPGYADWRRIISDKGIAYKTVSSVDLPRHIGDAEIRIIHPRPDFSSRARQAYVNENNQSLVVKITHQGKTLLFTGDIEAGAEAAIIRERANLKSDLLKVPHHGSRSSSTEDFVSLTRPELAIITAGRGNRYRHPADEVVARYERNNARIYRTDRDGAVLISMKNGEFHVRTRRELMFETVRLNDMQSWLKQEQKNWHRAWIRTWEL